MGIYGKFSLDMPVEFWGMRVYCGENVDCGLMCFNIVCCAQDALS
jgi:hypothetical protein